MTEQTEATHGAADAATKASEPKTVLKNMPTPRFFDSVEDASTYLGKQQEELSDFAEQEFVLNGLDPQTGEFDPELYGEGTRVMVHVLKNRGTKTKDAVGNEVTTPATVQCIVVTPVPSRAAIEADSQGSAWLDKILDTQIAHVAVGALRGADNLAVASKDMPLALADFVTARESGSVAATFDAQFRGIIDALKAKSPAWAKARITKAELKKAFESKAYAEAVYPTLEDRGDKPSLFVMAMQLGIREAKDNGLDPTIYETWIATRDAKELADESLDGEEADFDLDDLTIAKADAEPTEGATKEEAPASDSEGEGEEAQTEEAPAE